MDLPEDLKIFSMIYEYRGYVLLPLLAAWLCAGGWLLLRGRKSFFLALLFFPLCIQPLNLAAVYCGWQYRMELRDRYARSPVGWRDEFSRGAVNITLMPPEIRAEYAKHNYHPRFRDLKAMTAGIVVFTPLLYLAGGGLFLLRKFSERRPVASGGDGKK